MTIIDELLILLDDLEEARSDEIPDYFSGTNLQVIFSSLGRLVNRGLVAKKNRRGEISYSITSHGIEQLNQTLDAIKNDTSPNWSRQWHLVIFDIPESKRKLRDSFRNLLKEAGYGILKSSVWLSPWDKSDMIKRFSKRYNLNDYIFHIKTDPNSNDYHSLVLARQCWDWPVIEKSYREYINYATKVLSRLNDRGLDQRFSAKKLVFRYAEIVKTDPQLPIEIAPNATLARRTYELYTKIRPYCIDTIHES